MTASFNLRLIRHGETETNQHGIVEGHSLTPLNTKGLRQADALGASWRTEGAVFGHVVSSDTPRALQTCRRALDSAGVATTDPAKSPLLREWDIGPLTGLSYDMLREVRMKTLLTGQYPAGVEMQEDVLKRAGLFFEEIREKITEPGLQFNRTEVVVFSHSSVINGMLRYLQQRHGLDLPPELLPVDLPPELLPAGMLHFSPNTGQTRLLISQEETETLSVHCLYLHQDDHLTGDLKPTHYRLENLEKVPRDFLPQVSVYKTSSMVNATAPLVEGIWSVERQCAETCDAGCLTVGERTKITKCVSCCREDLCNYADGAATAHRIQKALLWVALLSLWLVVK